MKAELIEYPGKGICILISDIDPADFWRLGKNRGQFFNVNLIADLIRRDMKIPAIKEIRHQTGWGLKESKEYLDKYIYTGADLKENAEQFLRDHSASNFFEDNEFEI